jgi:hypothetical protein
VGEGWEADISSFLLNHSISSLFCLPLTPSPFSLFLTTSVCVATLQAILSRKLVLPEVYDLMVRVQVRFFGRI